MFAGQGLGSVVGAVLAPRLIERIGTRSALWMGVAVSTLAMCLPLLWPHWPVVLVAWTVQGVSTSFVVVSYFTARQELIKASAIGRAASVTRAVAYTALPVGALLGGWLVERSSSVRAVFGSAAAIEAALLVGLAIAGAPALHSGAASCSAGCGARPTPPATRRPSLRPSGAERQDRDWLVVLPIRADPWWLLLAVAIVGPLATRLFYLAATENYVAFGELVRSSIDLYRFDLLDALRVTRPHSLRDERVLWDTLQRVSAAGQEGIDLSYPQDPAPERQP